MQNIINKILESNLGARYLDFVASLDETQIRILIIITVLLVALLIYRWMGAETFWLFLFVIMLSYLIYKSNLSAFYKKNNEEYESRMKAIQTEMDGSEPKTNDDALIPNAGPKE